MPQTVTTVKPQPPVPPANFREGDIEKMDASGLIKILSTLSSTEFQKAKACVRLGELGAKEGVPALAALLDDEHLSVYARYGLEPIADPAAGEALRAAMGKLKGDRLIGVINSVGKRHDEASRPALAKLMLGADVELARASASALGAIGGLASAKELKAALAKTKGPVRTAVADASLVCAERLLAEGKREEALAFYSMLSAADIPKPMRLAAMSGIIREETSTSRPR